MHHEFIGPHRSESSKGRCRPVPCRIFDKVKEGVVIAENLAHFRGRDGIEIQARSAFLITLRDGQQTSLTLYQTKAEALKAASPSE